MRPIPRMRADCRRPSQDRWSKRRLLSGALVGALLLLAVPLCHAMPGDVLLDNCLKSFDELHPLEGGVCWGYLLGVWHTHSNYQGAGQVPRTVCADDQIPIGDLTRAFLAWAKESPEQLNREASECVLAALRASYPCSTPGVPGAPPGKLPRGPSLIE